MKSGKWAGLIFLLAWWLVSTGDVAAEAIPLDEIVKNNELPKRVALSKETRLSLSDSSSSGSITIPAGIGVEIVGVENQKLKIRFASATGFVAPEETDLAERVLLQRKRSVPVPVETASATDVSAAPVVENKIDSTHEEKKETRSRPKRNHVRHYRDPEPGSPLSKVKIPVDFADKKACQDYIDDILQAVQKENRNSSSDSDAEVGMLVKVGPANVDLLAGSLAKARYPSNYHLVYTINILATPEHRDIILKYLPITPSLIESVQKLGWQQDARPIILQELRNGRTDLFSDWCVMAANYGDSEATDTLRRYLGKLSCPGYLLKNLAEQTSFDVSDIAIKRYKEARRGRDISSVYELAVLAQVAALCGEADALKTLCDIFTGKTKLDKMAGADGSSYYKNDARKTVMQLTDARGSDEEIDKWVRDNFSRLKFDRDRKCYVTN